MTHYSRYFRVTSGPLLDEVNRITEARREAFARWREFGREVGAEAMHYSDGRFGGFKFGETPDPKVWTKPNEHGASRPKKNSTEGNRLLKRIKKLGQVPSHQDALKAAGLYGHIPVLIDGRYGYCSVLFGFPERGVMFVRVPWRDVPADELEQYRKDRAEQTRMSVELDHLLWEPPEEWEEVKEWQMLKEREELAEAA